MHIDEINEITGAVIGCAYEVHSALGPGLLESAYERCLACEIEESGRSVGRQVAVPLTYKSVNLDAGYRLDLLVDDEVIVEIKSVEKVLPIHRSQVLTYLRLTDRTVGLILNFNERNMQHGIHRVTREKEKGNQHRHSMSTSRFE
jgi:GxxExxY protein